jgi:hypothetical protein
MESQFNQLDELGLLKFNKGTSNAKVKLNADEKPEVIFILVNLGFNLQVQQSWK